MRADSEADGGWCPAKDGWDVRNNKDVEEMTLRGKKGWLGAVS